MYIYIYISLYMIGAMPIFYISLQGRRQCRHIKDAREKPIWLFCVPCVVRLRLLTNGDARCTRLFRIFGRPHAEFLSASVPPRLWHVSRFQRDGMEHDTESQWRRTCVRKPMGSAHEVSNVSRIVFCISLASKLGLLGGRNRMRGGSREHDPFFCNSFHFCVGLLQCPHRLVVRTSRCGRDNPGSTPGADTLS